MDSVLNQSYPDIEYIIIDGSSTDGTLDIINAKAKAYENVKLISEPDKGIYDALNKGIAMATGDVIGFVHSDDFLAHPEIISKIAKEFKSKDIDGVYGNLHYVQFDKPENIIRNWVSQPFEFKLLKRGWMPAHPTLFLKRELYEQYGRFNLNYTIAADYDFILRIFKHAHHTFVYLPETIVKMRVGGASNKSLGNLFTKSREDLKAVRLNQIPFPFKVVALKNLSKIPQWFLK